MKEKQTTIKIVKYIVVVVIVFVLIKTSIYQTSAAGLDYANPNSSKNNTYSFKTSDVLNSKTVMQVIGCTGVVDKVAGAMANFAGEALASIAGEEDLTTLKVDACEQVKAAALWAAGLIPNMTLTTALNEKIDCFRPVKAQDDTLAKALKQQTQQQNAQNKMTQCFNGIAVTLAKNQLTAITRNTMNWVNTGFGGNPLYVRNMTNLTNSIEKDVIQKQIDQLTKTDNALPFGNAFAAATVTNYNNGNLKTGATNVLNSLTSDLSNFITTPLSSGTTGSSNTQVTPLAVSQNAVNTFAGDFSSGGWNGWLAMTGKEANNPLGFTMNATNSLVQQQATQVSAIKNQVNQGNGFLSQSTCTNWQLYDKDGNALTTKTSTAGGLAPMTVFVYSPNKSSTSPNHDVCVSSDVVTPGSVIANKLNTEVNSPERQLELVKTINDALNSLFSNLINQLQNQGLPGLSSGTNQYLNSNLTVNDNMGVIGNVSNDGTQVVTNSAGYSNPNFDITQNLGNQYVHNYNHASLGSWDAKNNLPELYVDTPPADIVNPSDSYYVVSNAGNTHIIDDADNGWSVGDRAFWDGTHWQNWRKTKPKAVPTDPIAQRGVIQIQKDYSVVAKEILAFLPSIMPAYGELDYCLPGPNPTWNAASGDAENKFDAFQGTLNYTYRKGSLFKRKSYTYSIAQAGDPEFDDYRNIFVNIPDWWNAITSTSYWTGLISRGTMGTVKGSQAKLDRVDAGVQDFLSKIHTDENNFNTFYTDYVDHAFGPDSSMQKQYIESEPKIINPETDTNPDYLPMAADGYNLTKDMVAENSTLVANYATYKQSIIDASSNIDKLAVIKKQVDAIIIDAQSRRNVALLKLLNDNAIANNTAPLTEAQYDAKYATCLKGETVTYYDDLSLPDDIMGGDAETRCTDGIDNDLNGLIDAQDPACANYKAPVQPNYDCVLDLSETFPYTDPTTGTTDLYSYKDDTASNPVPDDTPYCTTRTAADCTSTLYYSQGIGMKCMLFSGNNNTLSTTTDGSTVTASSASTNTSTTVSSQIVPAVLNATVTAIQSTSAVLGATVTSLGSSSTILDRGICYFKDGVDPSTATCLAEGGTTAGSYSIPIPGLIAGTKYWFEGYADNSAGRGTTAPWTAFTTLPLN